MELLSWQTLQGHLTKEVPFTLPMGGAKGARLVCDPTAPLICLRLPASHDANVTGLSFVELETALRLDSGVTVLDVRLENRNLFQIFHQLAISITDYFEDENVDAVSAVTMAVQSWRDLILNEPFLSQEAQLGLAGELTLLSALVRQSGPSAVQAWTATGDAIPNRHDFRLNEVEIEVKTTRQRKRFHHINGVEQLSPSPGYRLFVLSLKYEDGGKNSTMSLADLVMHLRSLLAHDTNQLLAFEKKLRRARYRDADAPHYMERLLMVDEPRLVEITNPFPRITAAELSAAMTDELVARIHRVSYMVDFEGLGWSPNSPSFKLILGEIQIGHF